MDFNLNIFHDAELPLWIDEAFEKEERPAFVDGVLPEGYPHYFKLFFPVGLTQLADHGRSVQKTYRELAGLLGLKYTKRFSYTDLLNKFDGLPFDFTVLKKADARFVDELVNILGPDTVCTFYGPGEQLMPETFRTPWSAKGYFGDIRLLLTALNHGNFHDFNFFPEYIFTEDKAWCLGNKIFQSGILILGCGDNIAELITDQNIIEYISLGYNDEYIRLK